MSNEQMEAARALAVKAIGVRETLRRAHDHLSDGIADLAVDALKDAQSEIAAMVAALSGAVVGLGAKEGSHE